MESIVLGQPPFANIVLHFHITILLDSAFQSDSTFYSIVIVIKFVPKKSNDKKTKTISILRWTAQILVAITFLWGGVMKLFVDAQQLAEM